MERVQLEQRTSPRERSQDQEILSLTSQEVRLSNGHYSTTISATGGGKSQWRGLEVTRSVDDPTCSADGFHLYLRDLETGDFWSAAYQPTRALPAAYEFRFSNAIADISRVDHDIESRLTVCVVPDSDLELRRCRLRNRSSHPRRIEVTSYLEFVLATRDADANHPTFSKLFVETEYLPEQRAIVARRRPRGADEPERFGLHRLFVNTEALAGAIEFETNRKRFLGRGRDLAHPLALAGDDRLSGDEGPVLDPIGSLRAVVSLAPGESRELVFALGAAVGREALELLLMAIPNLAAAQELFESVEDAPLEQDRDTTQWISHPAHTPGGSRNGDGVPVRRYARAEAAASSSTKSSAEKLLFDNSYGGFSADGREYVIRLVPDDKGGLRLPPQPWVNVIANERAGCIATERGAGYMWAGNSRHNRLTAWHNDPVSDPHGEALWLRDEDAGVFWSPLPGPTPPIGGSYEVRHNFGYSVFHHQSQGLKQETTIFMAPADPVKLVRLRLTNTGDVPRRLTLFSCQHWLLGTLAGESEVVATEYDTENKAILARNPQRDVYRTAVAFSTVVTPTDGTGEVSHTGDRSAFIGRHGQLAAPAALLEGKRLDNRCGDKLDPCAAWQLPLELAAGATAEITFVTGEGADLAEATTLITKFRTVGEVQRAFDKSTAFWQELLSSIRVETPEPALDLMVNGWLAYQNLSCRIWGRSAYYQPGGAYGFRDQLQDSSAFLLQAPQLTRAQILRHAAQQFVEGDVLHWWHPDSGFGMRTRFSDDLVWLPFVTTAYVAATGDAAVLDEVVPFIAGEPLKPGQAEVGLVGRPLDQSATVYEHCCRALDRATTSGPHELPLMGSGDWNDGMNRVGHLGRGESVWLGFFIYTVLGQMIPHAERRGDQQRVGRYSADRARLARVLNTIGWDGQWYRRAFYDNGAVLGSAASDECQIDALAQAWAILSKVAPRERAEKAVEAVDERLVDEQAGLIRLLTPPFDTTPNDPGYIKGYVPGVRENGGQYSHGVLFYVRAVAELGLGSRAVELLSMMSPVARTATRERAEIFQTEPYVVAADVYSEPPHVGRGGWTWYTGSAGWMFRVAVESILGLSIEGGETLVLRPAISSQWPGCRVSYRLPDGKTQYEITIENPHARETGVTAATLDGKPAPVVENAARIAIAQDGRVHQVVVRL